jgi:EAL domain-containing protein (putative c-di-GMP-specific phosphodiesterase class I)/GGDEF domain-containing protein
MREALIALEAAGDAAYNWHVSADRIDWCGHTKLEGQVELKPLVSGALFHAQLHPEDVPLRLNAVTTMMAKGGRIDIEYRMRREVGNGWHWIHERSASERDAQGRTVRIYGVLRSIDVRKLRQTQQAQQVNYDPVSGHFTRQRLREAIQHALLTRQRYGECGAFIAIGVDDLPVLLRENGQLTVDALLRHIGERLEQTLRATDIIGRLEEDSFGALLPHCPAGDLDLVVGKLRQSLCAQPLSLPGRDTPLLPHLSFSALLFPEEANNAAEIVERSLTTLAIARQGDGYARPALSKPAGIAAVAAPLGSAADRVLQAMREDRVRLAFQPIVDTVLSQPDFDECLIRLIDLDNKIVPAIEFIAAVEHEGLARFIDRRVLDLAVGEMERYQEALLSINLTPASLIDPAWMRALEGHVRERPALAQRLIIEIAETAAISDLEQTGRFIEEIHRLGCRVALDDFGENSTDFRHLRTLGLDYVKVDGPYVRGALESEENRLFVRAVAEIARTYGIAVIAESVETAAHVSLMRELGVPLMQGYELARPTLTPRWRQAP